MTKACPICGTELDQGRHACECGHEFVDETDSGGADNQIGKHSGKSDSPLLPSVCWLLIIFGGALAFYAYAGFDPSVDGFMPGDYGTYGRRIINNGLLQQQLMLFMAGLVAFSAGIVLMAANIIVDALEAKLR
jgi:hypothetical protein